MYIDLDDYSALVGQIYDAALDASSWQATLATACTFVGASKSVLGSYSAVERRYELSIFQGYEPRWIELYHQTYGALNPLNDASLGQDVGEVRCLSEAGLIGAFAGDPMYENWVKPQRILDVAELVLDRAVDQAAVLSFSTVEEAGVFTDDSLGRIRLLFPHVRRSVLISRVLKMHRRSEGDLSQVIDGLAAGVFILSEQSRILRSNAAGARMLSEGALASDAGGTLRFTDGPAHRALGRALHSARDGVGALGARGLSIPLKDLRSVDFVAHLLPLADAAAHDDLETRGGKIAVFISPAQPNLARALETLSKRYGLTASESRTALALIEVGSAPMIAERFGVTEATVRTHLRGLFQKTGARRQSEIVGMLQGLASPFS